jgi:hypothetical protein
MGNDSEDGTVQLNGVEPGMCANTRGFSTTRLTLPKSPLKVGVNIEDSIIEFPLEEVIDSWLEDKFNIIRAELAKVLGQLGVSLVLDERTELLSDEDINKFFKENN